MGHVFGIVLMEQSSKGTGGWGEHLLLLPLPNNLERVLHLGPFVCLPRTFVFFIATASQIETKFSPLV